MDLSHTRVFLNGFMGCGKTTLGPLLASRLGLHFADLDDIISDEQELRIDAMFARHGEAFFRKLEGEALRRTKSGFVYALGGGALVSESNLDWALSNGLVLYLEVQEDELVRRLLHDTAIRPLLMGDDATLLSSPVLRQKIQSIMSIRRSYYLRSHIVLPAISPADILALEAAKLVRRYFQANSTVY